MQLVKRLPIPGPVQRDGGWYEDFTQTGAKTIGLVGGIQSEVAATATGLRLEPVTLTSRSVSLPSSFSSRFSDFEAEFTLRGYGSYTTSTDINLQFRLASNNDRMIVSKIGNNTLKLVRAKNGVYTTLATVTNVPFTSNHRIGIRAIGPLIEVYLDRVKVIAVTETHNMRLSGTITLSVYDPSVNVARGEFGYLVVRPLGYNPFVVQDSFNRTDGAIGSAESGQSWVTWISSLTVASGVLTNSTYNGRHDLDSFVSDKYELGVKLRFLSSAGTDRRAIILARTLTSGTDNCLEITLNRSAGHIKLGSRTTGAYADLVSPVDYALADNTDYWLKVTVQGQAIRVFLSTDGVTYTQYISTTSALYTSQTGVGVRLNDSSPYVNTMTADNFYMRRLP